MQHTPNLSLKLPEPTDFVQVEDLNENFTKIDEEIAKVTNEDTGVQAQLTEHLTDFEYQVPTVIGKQLQLIKKSGTKRLFIKIANDLSGPITVSLDNGASAKPLVDANGEAVNQLEKGFAEVVEDTSFFTLRSRGISSTDLQALIEIVNEAEANESDLKTQFARAVTAVDVDGGINLPDGAAWAEILAQVPNIKTGRKWATGVINMVGAENRLIINGLSFIPTTALAIRKGLNNNSNNTPPWATVATKAIDNKVSSIRIDNTTLLANSVSSSFDGPSVTLIVGSVGGLWEWVAFE